MKHGFQSLAALNALNFFMADVNGLGPYVGVYLQQQHWSPETIGVALSMAGLATMATTTPFGALVDRTSWKRAVVAASAIATVLASLAILASTAFSVVAASQIVTGIAAAAIGPAIAGITLGLVRQEGYPHQLGRNESFNHAGNIAAAAVVGLLGYRFGLWVTFAVMTAMAIFSLVSLSLIREKDISHRAARGMGKRKRKITGLNVLARSKPLILVAVAVTLFHLGNAAMLPLLGQSLAANGKADPSATMSSAIIIAQCTMIPVAIATARLAEKRGFWITTLLALIALPIRGLIAGLVDHPLTILPIQILDGISVGILGVTVPGMVARILRGTGHINAGLGAVLTMQAAGIAISPGLGGLLAGYLGYALSFLILGALAGLSAVVWVSSRVLLTESVVAKFEGQ